MSVCLFVSNERLNRSGPKLARDSHDPRADLGMIKISKINLPQNSIFMKFWKSTKFLIKSTNFCFCFTMDTKRKCSIEIEDGREVPWKSSIYIYVACLSVQKSTKFFNKIRELFCFVYERPENLVYYCVKRDYLRITIHFKS